MTVAVDVDAFLRHVAIERGLSANTVAAYRRDLAVYSGWMEAEGIRDLRQVTPATLSAFALYLGTREGSPDGAPPLAAS